VSPYYGDGPECDAYGPVTHRENLLVPLVIHGGFGAFVAGWIALPIALIIEKFQESSDIRYDKGWAKKLEKINRKIDEARQKQEKESKKIT
jgi:hypothetical protein